jgi:hypothetical protein
VYQPKNDLKIIVRRFSECHPCFLTPLSEKDLQSSNIVWSDELGFLK